MTGEDIFKNEKPTDFRFDISKIDNVVLYSCGYRYSFLGYRQSPSEILIPLSERNTDLLLDRLGASVRYDKDSQEIVFTREDKFMRMKVNYAVADFNGERREIPVPARIINGMVHISPNSFARFLWACYMYDDKQNIYYMDPFLMDVTLETERGLTKVVARGTGPFKYRILKLRGPNRFVIDVMNAVLDGKARAVDYPGLGPIRFSQHMLRGEEGNIVRIVIPETEDFEVALAEPRASNFVEAELRQRATVAPVVDMAVQQIQNLDVSETDNQVTITIDTTGPVQMAGNRLLPPDDRIFIDIPGVLYPDKKRDFDLQSSFLPAVRVAQFAPMPNPKVRIVLPLEGPRRVTMEPDQKNPNRVRIIISKEQVNPREDRSIYLVTYYPTRGIVICIDPGHGGTDCGAVNRSLKLYEEDVTLDISRRVTALLKKEGWIVALTRNSDRDVSYAGSPDYEELNARSSVGNGVNAHIFMSIHINASVSSSVCGFGTYWYKSKDQALASHVQKAMETGLNCRSIGTRRERFFVLAHTKMPSILVEAGFISNPNEARQLADPAFRQRVAQSIVNGLKSYARSAGLKGK